MGARHTLRRPTSMAVSIALVLYGSTAAGQVSFERKSVNTFAAERIASGCLDWLKTHPNSAQPAIWVLNAEGDPIYMKRLDGVDRMGVQTALMKAQSALEFGSTSGYRAFAEDQGGKINPAGVVALEMLRAFPQAGGVPIRVGGQTIGAVGVSGLTPDFVHQVYPDEQCAIAGIQAVFPASK